MSSSYGISHRRRTNSARQCSAPGCGRSRRGLSGYCAGHERRRNTYGSPNGRKIMRREYAMERHEVEAFVDKYLHHPGIQLALRVAPRVPR
jgi:hypothetical protein